jgi:hypothetical protein
MKRKQQQILYGLLALVIIFIIYKYMFKKTDNFSIGAPGGCGIFGCGRNPEPDYGEVRRSECIGISGPGARMRCGRASACHWNEPMRGSAGSGFCGQGSRPRTGH